MLHRAGRGRLPAARTRYPRGLLIGIAAAIKLTPASSCRSSCYGGGGPRRDRGRPRSSPGDGSAVLLAPPDISTVLVRTMIFDPEPVGGPRVQREPVPARAAVPARACARTRPGSCSSPRRAGAQRVAAPGRNELADALLAAAAPAPGLAGVAVAPLGVDHPRAAVLTGRARLAAVVLFAVGRTGCRPQRRPGAGMDVVAAHRGEHLRVARHRLSHHTSHQQKRELEQSWQCPREDLDHRLDPRTGDVLRLAMVACSSPGGTSHATSTTPTRTPAQAVATAPTEEYAQPGPSGRSGTRMCATANLVVTIEEAASPNSHSDLVMIRAVAKPNMMCARRRQHHVSLSSSTRISGGSTYGRSTTSAEQPLVTVTPDKPVAA